MLVLSHVTNFSPSFSLSLSLFLCLVIDRWGMPQESVMSHFLTFVNHGCNGTSNLGSRGVDPSIHTEFSIDLENGIPEDLKTEFVTPYNPSLDRDEMKYVTNCVAAKTIPKGEELYDNYMSFGGDAFFKQNVLQLRNQCSGGRGLVEVYQSTFDIEEYHLHVNAKHSIYYL